MASSSNTNATAVAIPPLDNTYGAIMLGTFGGLTLYGLTMHQCYRYMRLPYYKTDATYIKFMVALILSIETIHSALSMHACYYYLSTNYFHPEVLFRNGSWSINGLVIAISQSFFARRLFKLNPSYSPIAGFVVILLMGELALSVEAFVQPDLWMASAAMGMVIAADGTLTVLLTVVLHRSRTGLKSTDSMLNILIMYTINTGLLTGTISIVAFFMAVIYPDTLIDAGLNQVTAKLYANSMLAVLNSRHFLSNYGKPNFDCSPSKISAIHRSAFTSLWFKWPSQREVSLYCHNLSPRVTSN
ncbi:hypothetical protein GSI_05469 [Ganoderma sinense ZZ0214-1]|uniref:DUF6534 domain-containing protein n=1 Tax=Ganoderma sinense ZZ0214-1 TaxID=1077348 RepID=A0A2G8SEM4_9APHY|nr:hypothetical protein GSI_05469 [Ganoderma sinense ZZ0214-1]